MKKKSLLLIAVMLVITTVINLFAGMISVGAEPVYESGTGSEEDPYIISTKAQLQSLQGVALKDKHIKLGADIDLSESGTQTAWTPLTSFENGSFDGNGKTISGFKITAVSGTAGQTSFFGKVMGTAVIKNLKIDNATIQPTEYIKDVGFIAGQLGGNAKIVSVIVGENTSIIANFDTSTTEKLASQMRWGGLVGYQGQNYVQYCEFHGTISATVDHKETATIGGIVGHTDGSVEYCVNYGNVSIGKATVEGTFAGGIAGSVAPWTDGRNISNCINKGTVSASGEKSCAGGILGGVHGEGKKYNLNGNINLGTVSANNAGQITSYVNCVPQTASANVGATGKGALLGTAGKAVFPADAVSEMAEADILASDAYKNIDVKIKEKHYVFGVTIDDGITRIYNKDQLVSVNTNLNGSYKLMNDINLGGAEWTPFGEFKGTFDGNGKTVSNFKITTVASGATFLGFFGKVTGGTVKNLTVANAEIAPTSYVQHVGAIVGQLGSSAKLIGCTTASDVTVTVSNVVANDARWGGIAGYGGATIEFCVNNANVTVTNVTVTNVTADTENSKDGKFCVGGVIGGTVHSLKNCINNGTITVSGSVNLDSAAGGIAGEALPWSGLTPRIENSINTGAVSHTAAQGVESAIAGGILGRNAAKDNGATVMGYNYNVGAVTGTPAGQILGAHMTGSDAKFSIAATNYGVKDAGAACGTAIFTSSEADLTLTADELKNDVNYKGILAAINTKEHIITTNVASNFKGGKGTQNDPYTIETKQHLINLAEFVNNSNDTTSVYFKLVADIDLANEGEKTEFTPIGIEGKPFKGIFDGNGKTISGFKITSSSTTGAFAGLFGRIEGGAIVKNVRIANADIVATFSKNVGGIVGVMAADTTVSRCATVADVTLTAVGSHDADLKLGGIVGYAAGLIEYCENNATVIIESSDKTNHAAGIAGGTADVIKYCINKGTVTNKSFANKPAKSYAAGIVSQINPWGELVSKVENCVNYATVSNLGAEGEQFIVGGIIGIIEGNGTTNREITSNYNFAKLEGAFTGQTLGTMTSFKLLSTDNFGVLGLGWSFGEDDGTGLPGMTRMLQAELLAKTEYEAILTEFDSNFVFTLGTTPDAPVITDPSDPVISSDDEEYYEEENDEKDDEEEETAESTTDDDASDEEPKVKEKKGCGSAVMGAFIPVIAMIGAVSFASKKKED